ncbi:hypothetical protein MKW92_052200 [Papaver armeniacum]|nr:hypothetical protein MKW92_052200 [Papaver armeniacum]
MFARIYENPGGECAAFLCNNRTREPATATFRGNQYYLPAHSISILPDCKTVVYNTQTVVAQHNARTNTLSKHDQYIPQCNPRLTVRRSMSSQPNKLVCAAWKAHWRNYKLP